MTVVIQAISFLRSIDQVVHLPLRGLYTSVRTTQSINKKLVKTWNWQRLPISSKDWKWTTTPPSPEAVSPSAHLLQRTERNHVVDDFNQDSRDAKSNRTSVSASASASGSPNHVYDATRSGSRRRQDKKPLQPTSNPRRIKTTNHAVHQLGRHPRRS